MSTAGEWPRRSRRAAARRARARPGVLSRDACTRITAHGARRRHLAAAQARGAAPGGGARQYAGTSIGREPLSRRRARPGTETRWTSGGRTIPAGAAPGQAGHEGRSRRMGPRADARPREGGGRRSAGGGRRAPHGAPGSPVGRGQALGAGAPPGHRCVRARTARSATSWTGSTRRACTVSAFKVPTPIEAAHDYLWRIHQRMPRQGRDRDLQPLPLRGGPRRPGPRARAQGRVVSAGMTRSTPSSRSSPTRARRSSSSSSGSRRRSSASSSRSASTTRPSAGSSARATSRSESTGPTTSAAFEEALRRCSTEWAPWYVIPSNRKWFRNVAVAQILGDTIADLDPQYPPGEPGIEGLVVT